ncbi:MAG: acyltransferase [Anaerolineales bacterium]|nr:acyltransferase [Anaerolineales bacterium]MBX3037494.1 acyltransferase [Anaerolineales bacterium]
MIPGLDGLRAVAFLTLFALHAEWLQFGWMGVQLFFVLSGFLITDILLRMKEKLSFKEYLVKFYIRRFLRIFPLYYFFLLVMLGISTYFISINYKTTVMQVYIDQIGYAFLYIYNFFAAHINFQPSPLIKHLWSLSVEEQFYIFWPLLIFFMPTKYIKQLFTVGIILGPLFRLSFFILYELADFQFLRTPFSTALYSLPFTHIDAFAFGAYISRFSIPKAKEQLKYLTIAIPIIGFSTHYLATGEFGILSALGYPNTMPHAYQFIWAYTLLNYWCAVIIYCVVKEKMFLKFLETAPLRYLGKISYGLYIYHFPMLWFAIRIRDIGFAKASHFQFDFLAFVGTILIASLSYYLLEKPFIQMKDRFASYAQT